MDSTILQVEGLRKKISERKDSIAEIIAIIDSEDEMKEGERISKQLNC